MAYDTETITKVGTHYESGDSSIRELVQKFNISAPTIESWIQKYKWVKGRLIHLKDEKKKENWIEIFARLGLTEEKVAKKVIDLIDKGDKEGLIQYFKLAGSYAPVKREVTGKDGESLIPSKMSEEELDKRIRSMMA